MWALCDVGGTRPASRFADGIHYLEIGGYDAQPPIVLIHGGGGGAANWYRMFAPLSAKRRVLAPDLPGFGLSDRIDLKPPLGTQTAHRLRDWLDAIAVDRVILIGTSFGGLAALRFAQHFPCRVERLVLIDSAGGGSGVPNAILNANMAIAEFVYRPTRRGTRKLLRQYLIRRRLPEVEENALVEYLYLSARGMGGRYMIRALRKFMIDSRRRPVQAEQLSMMDLATVTMPTLIVWGEEDRFFPATHGEALGMRIANSRRIVIRGSGHSPNWDQPEELAGILDSFLDPGHP